VENALAGMEHLVGPRVELRVIRSGHRLVLRNDTRSLLVRVHPPDVRVSWIVRELEICRHLARAGVPAPAPADLGVEQPLLAPSGYRITVWRLLRGRPGGPQDYQRLGAQLRLLHAAAVPSRHDWGWSPEPLVAGWLSALESRRPPWLPGGAVGFLRAEVAGTTRRADALTAPDDLVICHGDAHPGNLFRTQRGDLLLDYEYAGVGPRDWDLSETRCHVRRFGVPVRLVAGFTAGYGEDPLARTGSLPDELLRLRELLLTAWALYRTALTGGDPIEALLRLSSVTSPDRSHRWSAQ
jgi:Ser/Thr protein kinase RdoA (MazF antagonist)